MSSTLHIDVALVRSDFELAVTLDLPANGVTGVFGASGSGKTTLLRCIAGLEQARGRVVMGTTTWQDSDRGLFVPTWERDLGLVFQEASLFEHMTVQQNLEYGMKRCAKPGGDASLGEAIALLGIEHLTGRAPQSLSGGERQRVAIARALATQPAILLLDEPLASLDMRRKKEVLPWLERLHRTLNIPILYVTHSIEELTRLAHHVVVLDSGHIAQSGTVDDLRPVLQAHSW